MYRTSPLAIKDLHHLTGAADRDDLVKRADILEPGLSSVSIKSGFFPNPRPQLTAATFNPLIKYIFLSLYFPILTSHFLLKRVLFKPSK